MAASLLPEQADPTDLQNIIAIAATQESSYALSADGSLWEWGSNGGGQLGLATNTLAFPTPQHLLPPAGYRYTSIGTYEVSDHVLATLSPVPEPGSLTLLIVGGAALLRRRRRRSDNARPIIQRPLPASQILVSPHSADIRPMAIP